MVEITDIAKNKETQNYFYNSYKKETVWSSTARSADFIPLIIITSVLLQCILSIFNLQSTNNHWRILSFHDCPNLE